MDWATHKDAAKYRHLDNTPVETKPYPGAVLPPSQFTPEAYARRAAIHKRRKAEGIAGLSAVLAPKKGGGD